MKFFHHHKKLSREMRLKRSKYGLAKKMGSAFGTLICIILIVCIMAVLKMHHVQKKFKILEQEYIPQVEKSGLLEHHVLKIMYHLHNYILSEEEQEIEKGMKELQIVKDLIQAAQELAERAPHLVTLKETLPQVETGISEFEKVIQAAVTSITQMIKTRQVLDETSQKYMQTTHEFLESQRHTLDQGIPSEPPSPQFFEHLKTTRTIHKVIELGNIIRLKTYQAQALLKPEFIQNTQGEFELIEEKLEELASFFHTEENIQRINTIGNAAQHYQQTLHELLSNWMALQEVGQQGDLIAVPILKLTRNIAVHGMQETKHIAEETDTALLLASRSLIIGQLITIIAGIVIAKKLTRGILDPVMKGVNFAKAVAAGDFSATIGILPRDEIGMLINALKEMKDRIYAVLQETDTLICAVQGGKMNVHGNTEAFEGDWRKLIVGINDLIDAFVTPITKVATALDQIANGDLPEKMTEEYKGDFNEIKNNLNMLIGSMNTITQLAEEIANGNLTVNFKQCTQKNRLMGALKAMLAVLNDLLGEMGGLIRCIQNGNLKARGNPEGFSGGWQELIIGINQLIEAFVIPLNTTAGYIDRIAKGDIPEKITSEHKGDLNDVKNNLNMLIEATGEITRIAQEIAGGNVKVEVQPRSEQDELMQALEKMISYIQDVAEVAERISGKELQIEITPKSDQDVLNHSLRNMVNTLQTMHLEVDKTMTAIQQQNWLKTGQAELSNTMRGEQEPVALAQNIVTYLAGYLQAQVGAIYLTDEENLLRLVGSYAYLKRKGNLNAFKLGEGLIGQAALEKHSIVFSDIPENYIRISSGLGNAVPQNILVAPFLYENEVKGIIELGTAKEFRDIDMDFLNQAAENIAVAFNTAQTRSKMQELLDATQQQAEELQIQQENLRVVNEELEAQAQTLRESERKLQFQQEELRQSNKQLESQTEELQQQQTTLEEKNMALQQAQREVEEKAQELEISSKYKSEFLANMSHELRTPLNSLLILSKLLTENKEGNLTGKQLEFTSTIHAAGSDLLELINEVLDLSKIEAGKMTLAIEAMNLQELSDYVTQNFQHVVEDKGLTFSIELAEDVPATIRTDRQRMKQIVKNFLSNALKFTTQGSLRVQINRPVDGSFSRIDPAHAIAIAVTDTGIGIPEDKQHVIFEAFQQADGTTSRKYGGTGLGLSISRELAKLLGGEIRLQSQEGQGSTFTLYLPESLPGKKEETSGETAEGQSESHTATQKRARSVSAPSQPSPLPPVSVVEAIPEDNREQSLPVTKNLLIIEDDARFADILGNLASEKGFNVLIASNGTEGSQLAAQHKLTGIVLDVGLPDMDGRAVIEKLKTNPDTQHIPIIVYTGKELSKEEENSLKKYTRSIIIKGAKSHERLLSEISLFLHQVDRVTPEKPQADQLPPSHAGSEFQGKTVLLVDDDIRNVFALTNVFENEEMTVIMAESGKEALELLPPHPEIDLVLMDIMMPEMDGYETMRAIRKQTQYQKLPVIALTAKAMKEDRQKCLDAGANDYLSKPIDMDKLFSLLRVWLC